MGKHLIVSFADALEKQNRALNGDIGDKTQRLDDLHTSLAEADITKKKLSVEKADLEKQIDEADKTLRALGKIKSSLTTQVSSTFFWLRVRVFAVIIIYTRPSLLRCVDFYQNFVVLVQLIVFC